MIDCGRWRSFAGLFSPQYEHPAKVRPIRARLLPAPAGHSDHPEPPLPRPLLQVFAGSSAASGVVVSTITRRGANLMPLLFECLLDSGIGLATDVKLVTGGAGKIYSV